MLFSVKMRAAQGGAHEKGGRHISGAERILPEAKVEEAVLAMLKRAREHERGKADFISIKVEAVTPQEIAYKPLLAMESFTATTVAEGHQIALTELEKAGVSKAAAHKGIGSLLALNDSMRGAMLLDAVSGERLDGTGARGIRVTKMDCANSASYEAKLLQQGLVGEHVREALVLASKVAGSADLVAELCWSDDPQYVTGYVASQADGYKRIPVMKERGNPVGGRIFFVRPEADLVQVCHYLQEQVVMIRPEVEHE
ncbi:MAG: 6-carboxyhexanoate--CoA ligase [Acidaminococcaceae bacterium]